MLPVQIMYLQCSQFTFQPLNFSILLLKCSLLLLISASFSSSWACVSVLCGPVVHGAHVLQLYSQLWLPRRLKDWIQCFYFVFWPDQYMTDVRHQGTYVHVHLKATLIYFKWQLHPPTCPLTTPCHSLSLHGGYLKIWRPGFVFSRTAKVADLINSLIVMHTFRLSMVHL